MFSKDPLSARLERYFTVGKRKWAMRFFCPAFLFLLISTDAIAIRSVYPWLYLLSPVLYFLCLFFIPYSSIKGDKWEKEETERGERKGEEKKGNVTKIK